MARPKWLFDESVGRPYKRQRTTGNWEDVGHYTQMIWRGTRRVGCALGEGAQYDYLVCRYYPAGNVYGMSPFDRDFGGWQG